MKEDDRVRGQDGVVLSIKEMLDGKLRLTLDDVENLNGQASGEWKHRVFVTHKEYDAVSLEELELPESEYAALGHYVLARLVAIRKTAT